MAELAEPAGPPPMIIASQLVSDFSVMINYVSIQSQGQQLLTQASEYRFTPNDGQCRLKCHPGRKKRPKDNSRPFNDYNSAFHFFNLPLTSSSQASSGNA